MSDNRNGKAGVRETTPQQPPPPPDPTAQARQVLQQAVQERVRRCGEKIQRALDEEQCLFEASVLITPQGQLLPQVQLRPKG